MSSVNKVIIIGNLGADPEIRTTQSGQTVAQLSIATSDTFTDKQGNRQERTEWHTVIAWAKLAELCQRYLAKGRKVYVEGRLQTRSWEDQQTGQKRYKTEIRAREITFLDSGQGQQPQQNGNGQRHGGGYGGQQQGYGRGYQQNGAQQGMYQQGGGYGQRGGNGNGQAPPNGGYGAQGYGQQQRQQAPISNEQAYGRGGRAAPPQPPQGNGLIEEDLPF